MKTSILRPPTATMAFTALIGLSGLHSPHESFAGHEADMTGMSVVSEPAPAPFVHLNPDDPDGDTYHVGQLIRIEATFSQRLRVSGQVTMDVTIGDSVRTATYQRGSGTNKLVFKYEVTPTDADTNGISVPASDWGGSGSVRTTHSNFDAEFTPLGLATQSGHKVDGSLGPWVTAVEIASTPASGSTYRYGEKVEIDVRFSGPVRVESGNRPFLAYNYQDADGGTSQKRAGYKSGSGTNTLRLSFPVESNFKDDDGPSILSAYVDAAGSLERRVWALDHDVRAPWRMKGIEAGTDHKLNGEPYVKSVAITSTPEQGKTYRRAEVIRITATFDQKVTVEGTLNKGLRFTYGDNDYTNRRAGYASGSGTRALVFEYTVRRQDKDPDGLSILHSNNNGWGGGGKIWSALATGQASGTQVQADRSHGETVDAANHKVNGELDPIRPAISSIEIVTDPDSLGTYTAGEWIGVRATFHKNVVVTGTPQVELSMGAQTKNALFGRGSFEGSVRPGDRNPGPNVFFGYRVQEGDIDTSGIAIGENKLALNGGAINNAADSTNTADLDHDALAADAGQKVDAVAPAVSSIAISSDAGDDSFYAIGDSIEVTVTFTEEITVTGTPQLGLAVGSQARLASYRATEGAAAVLSYVVVEGDGDGNGISIEADTLSLNGGAIGDLIGNAADLTHDAVAADADHKVDGEYPTLSNAVSFSGGTYINLNFSERITVPPILSTISSFVNVELDRFYIAVLSVTMGDDLVKPSSATLNGSRLRLNLAAPLIAGQRTWISYDNIFARDAAGLFIDRAGNPLANFSNTWVINQSNVADGESDVGELKLSLTETRVTEGASASYTVALKSQPSAEVTVAISSSSTKLSVSPASLTFTAQNWETAQTVTLTADEDDDELNYWVSVTHTGSGGGYEGSEKWVLVVIEDDDGEEE